MARREMTEIAEKDFERWKKTILFAEEYIGVSLCYDLEVDNDFSFFLKTSNELQGILLSVKKFRQSI
jgi:hypothetical protein